MRADHKRSIRINVLYRKAKTGRYTYIDLLNEAIRMGVTSRTAKSYIDTIAKRLNLTK